MSGNEHTGAANRVAFSESKASSPDDLVTGNQWLQAHWQLVFDHLQVCAADAAGLHAHE